MDTYRVFRHRGDEDEGARWACRARQQLADGSPGRTDDRRVVRDFKLEPTTREV